MNYLRRLSAITPIILGSGSPRRKDLLQQAKIPFTVKTADISETIPAGEAPEQASRRLAELKAHAVSKSILTQNSQEPPFIEPFLIIASDTIVWHNGDCLGKPVNIPEARETLWRLRGQKHHVYTAISMLLHNSSTKVFSEQQVAKTAVTFKDDSKVSDEEIERYLATGDSLDKAGAYGAQELGSFLVDHLEGALDTVIGFPLLVVDELAAKFLQTLGQSSQNH